MSSTYSIENLCLQLVSSKVTERKKAHEHFIRILQKEETIEHLNQNRDKLWTLVLNSVREYLTKEVIRASEEKRKKKASTPFNASLFFETVNIMVKEGRNYDVTELLKCVSSGLDNEEIGQYLGVQYLNTLHNLMLPNEYVRAHIEACDWNAMYKKFKKRFKSECSIRLQDSKDLLETIAQFMKYGPLHGLSPEILREEFGFISNVCKEISTSCKIPVQEAVVKITYYFGLHVAKDNRMSCCKLGEETFPYLIALYEIQNPRGDEMKHLLIEFLLMQVVLHHPKGIPEGNPGAYAYSWEKWNHCLNSTYKTCLSTVTHIMKHHYLDNSFIISHADIKFLQKDFVRLLAEIINQLNWKAIQHNNEHFHEESKRRRIDTPVSNLINLIETSQHWVGINVMCTLLQLHPEILTDSDFIYLLQLLSKLQVDSKEVTVLHHIYCCLSILIEIESIHVRDNSEVRNIWNLIKDTTLRSFGLNQNDLPLHELLQKLILHNVDLKSEIILRTYTSDVLNVTECNLKTLEITFNCLSCSQNEEQNRTLIKWILSKDSLGEYRHFSKIITAKVLVGLIVNSWPTYIDKKIVRRKLHKFPKFGDISDSYLISEFEDSLLQHENEEKCENNEIKKRNIVLDQDACTLLIHSFEDIIESMQSSEDEKVVLIHASQFIALIKNILSYLLDFMLIKEEDVEDHILLKMLPPLFRKLDAALMKCFKDKNLDDLKITLLNGSVTCFLGMFSTCFNAYMDKKFREIMPTELLKTLISFLQSDDREKKNDFKDFKLPLQCLRTAVLHTLVHFSCGLNENSIPNQKLMLVALAEFDYNIDQYTHSALPMVFLDSVGNIKLQSLDDGSISAIISLLFSICRARYKYYACAVQILKFSYDFYQLVASYGSDDTKNRIVDILYPFYVNRNNYGPGFQVALVNCLGKLYEVDPDFKFAKWEGREVILKLPEFICSKYQEVRFAAIKNLIIFFELSSQRKNIRDYHLQELIIQDISVQCDKVFEVEGTLTEERKVDETITRTASILHALTSIFMVSNQWREECLFTLFKIYHKRQLVPESLSKILKITYNKLGLDNVSALLENYMNVILRRWISEGLDIDVFPIFLFGCDNKISFYTKYIHDILPFIVEFDQESLTVISDQLKQPIERILQEFFSTLCVNSIVSAAPDLSMESLERNTIRKLLLSNVDSKMFKELFIEKIDEIILGITSTLLDENDFNKKFHIPVLFIKSNTKTLNMRDFDSVQVFIQNYICPGTSLMPVLLSQYPHKLQRLTMQLNVKTSNFIAIEDKLRSFHHFTIISDLIIPHLNSCASKDYFIRDLCYTFLRYIENGAIYPELSKIVLIYFKTFLEELINDDCISKQFGVIVTTLINVVMKKNNEDMGKLSMNLLKYLIIDNKERFKELIKHMDKFPESTQLAELCRAQLELKSDDDQCILKKEIQDFVNFYSSSQDCSFRLDSLRNLKVNFYCQKRQLKNMYDQLSELKGFSEDCENSLLHQLISLLVDFSQSKEKVVSMEALKCLGELGPSDLMTLIVRPEKHISYVNSTPYEFVTGQVLSLLNMYLIDDNVQLIPPTSEILYHAINIKEGRKVIGSNDDFGYGPLSDEYLIPFKLANALKTSALKVDINQLISKIDLDDLWCPTVPISYQKWIRGVLCNILQTITESYIPLLIPVCNLKVEFCEALLPSIIYLLVSQLNNVKINSIITLQINKFFEHHWLTSESSNGNLISQNKKAVQVMLSVVHFVRVNKNNMKLKRSMEDLDLDYLKIAKAAQYCSAYFTALLYVELWCHSKVEMVDNASLSFKNTIIDLIYETGAEELSLAVLSILRSSYKAIGDQDSLQGCGTSLLIKPHLRLEYIKDAGMWDQAILIHNLQISRGIQHSKEMLIDSYKMCGLYETSLLCKAGETTTDYECMWRLSDWSLPETGQPVQNIQTQTFEQEVEKYKYLALRSVHQKDILGVMEFIEKARLLLVEKLKHTSLESSCNLYSILTFLQSFNEIEEFLNARSVVDFELVWKNWEQTDDIGKHNFGYEEPVMTQRMIVLNDYYKNASANKELFKQHLIDSALKLSEKARLENKTHVGIRALSLIQNLSDLTLDESTKISLEDAQLCWKTNNCLAARKILHLISSNENVNPRLRSLALKLNGKWSIESRSEHSKAVINDYLLPSLTLLEHLVKNRNDYKSMQDTYDTLGRYGDQQYQQVTAGIGSDIFQKKVRNMQKALETIKQLSTKKNLTLDEKKARSIHERQYSMDKAEIENKRKEKIYYLHIALNYYLKNLKFSDANNFQVFRVMALFLENRSCEAIMQLITEYIPAIASFKFITILPQLIPHIASKNADFFSTQANRIIERCAIEHPHHALPILLALANSNKDAEFSDSKTKLSINEERVADAKKLVKELKKQSSLNDIINRLESLSDALVELAYTVPDLPDGGKNRSKRCDIPRKLRIMHIKNFTSVAVPTDNLPVNKNGKYENVIGIHSYEKYYDLVGGINAPKKISCLGTDGKRREQLVKGQDDLRQDAVMQQVFTIMNHLLSLNKQTHGLKIRTYKIVPLSMRSGVLEWATNTLLISEYLIGDKEKGIRGAHEIYRPNDKSPSFCKTKISEAAKHSDEDRLRVFNRVCEYIKPVFHKFFEEKFLHPTVWYERRRAYIHSVATTSMCGYILGIGDRHVSNILIDETTAEVVHIDFGIAFEQGRILPTPETVPFRLTRDFVDAMGISGVEGAFRRSCEKTMTVLRDNNQTIMAILEVLLYDPLYSWTVSVTEANKRQRGSLDETANFKSLSPSFVQDDTSVNTSAERALLRLKAKLHGIEEGMPMSIEHQVGALIHKAMDPQNLSKLFYGWQAYL